MSLCYFTGHFLTNISTLLWTSYGLGMVYSKPLGGNCCRRSQFEQSVGLGDFCDCIYCPWPGQLCTCSHRAGEAKQDKKAQNTFHPYKRKRESRSWLRGESVTGELWPFAVPSRFGRAAAPRLGAQGMAALQGGSSSGPEPLAGITDTPILLFGVADKCSFLLKAKNTELREQEDEVPAELELHKVQETLPGVAWLCCTWLLASLWEGDFGVWTIYCVFNLSFKCRLNNRVFVVASAHKLLFFLYCNNSHTAPSLRFRVRYRRYSTGESLCNVNIINLENQSK